MRARLLLATPALVLPLALALPASGDEHAHTAVTIKSYAYAPDPFTVHVGDTVVWTNEDTAPHTVTSVSGPTKLDSPQLGKGGTWTWTATTAGSYRYYCAVHPDMKAGFTVLAAAPSPVAAKAAPAAPRTVRSPAPPPAAKAPAAAAVVAPPAAAPVSSPAPVASVAAEPAAEPAKALDPTLLLVALTAGAVLTALLALGRAVRP